ncbi:MAG: phycobilisome linker polypeptide [Leptolyngbya sp. DLM2.Bin15]|nr:MAG: phycobilisome linker polypeptide [Leptolyngbya sp. DLM2.Bin15]
MNEFQPITVSRRSSREEREIALMQIYRQVLERVPYSYERKAMAKAERDFLSDKIGVRRFLKELGHSRVYLDSFYYSSANLKFLELCFKHFMGRAPINQDEIRTYCDILMKQGVHHVITAILDSEEYRKVFGCFTVPYARQTKYYESPKAYLESDILNHEHIAQRGRAVPTLYWHQLGLNCEGGVCMTIEGENPALQNYHPEVKEAEAPQGTRIQQELLELLHGLDAVEAQRLVASLHRKQDRV